MSFKDATMSAKDAIMSCKGATMSAKDAAPCGILKSRRFKGVLMGLCRGRPKILALY